MIVLSWTRCTESIMTLCLFADALGMGQQAHSASGGGYTGRMGPPSCYIRWMVGCGCGSSVESATIQHMCYRARSGRVSVAVCGCVSFHCKLPLVDLHGNMIAARYRDEVLMPWLDPHMDGHALADRPIFQQDKAPPHTARLTTDILQNAAVDVLPWPSMPPDMNIIEHVWSHIASQINMMEHMPATAHDFATMHPRHLERHSPGLHTEPDPKLPTSGPSCYPPAWRHY